MAIAECSSRTKRDAATVQRALRIIEQQLGEYGPLLISSRAAKDYLRLRMSLEKREIFMCLFLTAQNQLIEAREMFAGTLTQTAVYPREVARVALEVNAASVMLAHNHPGGAASPSEADKILTATLGTALSLLDIGVLDHFIVGRESVFSFVENGIDAGMQQRPICKRIETAKRTAKRGK